SKTPFSPLPPVPHAPTLPTPLTLLTLLTLAATGCQVLTYTSPTGERFTRSSLGSTTSLNSLSVVTDTSGLRRVELRGYKNDSSQALGVVTAAAVNSAVRAVKCLSPK